MVWKSTLGYLIIPLLCICDLEIIKVEASIARLTGGDGRTTGRVEVSKNGTDWGTVCDDLWSDREAQVVCRQLNFQWGTAYSSAAFGEGEGDIFLDNVQCTGTETNLGECQHNGWGNNNCRHYEDAGVACYNSSVRVKSRGRTDVGTVEIRLNEGWVEVCDQDWDNVDAKVLCREMGFMDGLAMCCSTLGVDQSDSSPNKAFTSFHCEGPEKSLLQCPNQEIRTKCASEHRASAICYNKTISQVDMSFAVRLGNGSDSGQYWGEVNVRHKGVWGQVCSMGDNWNDKAAGIVCKQLGFKGGAAYGTVNETFMPSWIIDMNCTGTEKSLEECAKGPWGRPVRSCKPAYALCYSKGISVSLKGGGEYYGRVELTHDSHTGTICDKAWSTSDARVVCKQLGFADGDPVTGSYYGGGTGPVMMNGLGCYGYETNIVHCRNKGWMTYKGTSCDDHKNDASVVCYKNVRLSRGDHSHGVVQIMEENWSVLCGEGFTDKEAKIVCTQLGFQDGMALAMGSFGTFYGKYVRPNVSCNGTEKSILDCSYDKFRACQKDSFLGYAVVSCFNGSLSTEKNMKLDAADGTLAGNQTGRVTVQQYGIWGRVCPNSWDDNDATVVCRMLGYLGGVAYKYTSSGYGPYTLGKVGCNGTENSLFECPVSSGLCDAQFSSGDAGVLCYSVRKPVLHLVGSANSGHLEIILDSFKGTICDFGWSRYDASVACKQLGFQDGEPRSHYPSSGATVVMSSMGCYGGESSIFMCRNPGWQKNIDERCYEANRNAGVFCYNNVRISGGQNNENTTAGKVEMYHHGNWVTMCAKGFDDNDARVVCRELGFPNSKALVPGAFGRRYYSEYVLGFNCTGSEITIASCPYDETGDCDDRSSNYASVLCSKFAIDSTDIRILPFGSFPATVVVEKHGMNGTICAEGWDNKDADVLCRQLGYSGGGVSFGPQYSGSSTPIWMTNVECKGNESKITNCKFQETPTSGCLSNHMAARVYCYEGPGFQVRLVNGSSPGEGLVQVSYGGEWGTICDSYWADNDARVVCRQLGYLDGVAQPNSFYGAGEGPSWLYYVRCDGDEKSIWSCTNSGFNVSHTSCRNHKYDASVYCTDRVRLEPNVTYGAVEIWNIDKYQLVCADGFDDVAAKVVCRSAGFKNGISVCCSAFGEMSYDISYFNMRCQGDESTILNCKHSVGVDGCPSQKYASVACSDSPASGEYELRLNSHNRGTVSIRHFDIWGYICADNFDDAEAMVICREMGFQGGFAYFQVRYNNPKNIGIPWLSNVNCTGQESYLGKCGNIRWGSVERCKSDTDPAVYCYQKEGYKFRLANGTSSMSGRVEMSIDEEWGTVCGTAKFDDEAAHVLCKQLGYTSGRALSNGYFGEGDGKIMIPYLRCAGNESSLLDCGIKIEPKEALFEDRGRLNFALRSTYYTCRTHRQDAAVQCYNRGLKISLANGSAPTNGRVQLSVDQEEGSICGFSQFTDVTADILCRDLNYMGGRRLSSGTFGSGQGKFYFNAVNCKGNEAKLMECPMLIERIGESSSLEDDDGPSISGESAYARRRGLWSRTYYRSACWLHQDEAAVQCYDTGLKISLVNGTAPSNGRVQLSIDNEEGSICGFSQFTDSTADVLCRDLNYTGGRQLTAGAFGSGQGKFYINAIHCKGKEAKILECPMLIKRTGDIGDTYEEQRFIYRSSCWLHEHEAAVQCYDTVRLSKTNDLNYGILEVYEENTGWSAVCDKEFNEVAARVACRELGYMDGKFQPGSVLGANESEKITISQVKCNGGEKSLNTCQITRGECPTSSYVTIYCNESVIKIKENLELRIQDGAYYGSLEANKYGFWGPICPVNWTDSTANATCRQLGYMGGMAYNGSSRLDTPMALGNFNCKGKTGNLSSCSYHGFNENIGCQYPIKGRYQRPTAGVLCYNHEDGVKFRVEDKGRVQINFNGEWGRVCNSSWGDKEAGVLCRQLGYIDGIASKFSNRSKGHVWMNYIECEGKEKSILECSNTWTPGSANCDDAGVVCLDSVMLTKGDYASHGAVEVNINNHWGLVCNDDWDQKDVDVTCRQLGFQTGLPLCCAPYGYIKSHGTMETIRCRGNETRLIDCPHEPPYGSMCSMDYAAAACYNGSLPTTAEVSIAGKNGAGPVVVNFMNISGRICADDWDDLDAMVVCRQLGYANGQAYNHYKWSTGRGDNAPFWTSHVKCTGKERSLDECPKTDYGKVNDCVGRHFAGALCFQNYGVSFRMVGGENNYGRVEVSVDKVWGTICNRYWDVNDARVLCRYFGYVTGFPLYTGKFGNPPDKVYESNLHCNGSEESLQDCPHEGWEQPDPDKNCADHSKDAAVYCYSAVKLGSGVGKHITHGPVLYYNAENNNWQAICDKGFNDYSAALVCQELGFNTGKSISGSAYGKIYEDILENKTLTCDENSKSVESCLIEGPCNETDFYASVACFKTQDLPLSEDYNFEIQKGEAGDYSGTVTVRHYGLYGRICSSGWDDIDAMIMCRSLSYQHGIAYHQSDNEFSPLLGRGPYWMGDIHCKGNEPSLVNCSFTSRLDSKNCTDRTNAAVLCYNDEGIKYRIVNDEKPNEPSSFGRVEISLNNVWGTVCDASWDDMDARVLCREKGFHDGYALTDARYGPGKVSPIWLSHLKCTGDEESLHKCPHRGFNSAIVDGTIGWWQCKSHKDDASVQCVNDLKLSGKFNQSVGAVLVYNNLEWHAVCDTDFDSRDARVACRTLGYSDGKVTPGSAFGNLSSAIGVNSVRCEGNELEFKNCKMDFSSTCPSGTYASVYCSSSTIIDTGFHVRVKPDYDKVSAQFHGYLEVHIEGIWGTVCSDGWDDQAASVACREMGYTGGAAYRPPKNFSSAILMDKVKCTGNEKSLNDCSYQKWNLQTGCNFYSERAGVFCYNDTGLEFRLGGGEGDQGRVEMKYGGVWGSICDWLWDSRDARVFCRNLGYADGLEVVGARYGHTDGPLWFTRVSCKGDEASVLQCRHTGFNSSDEMEGVYAGLCRTRSHDAAARCFNTELEITDIRMVNSQGDPTYGRVEVFLAGADQWGTVCDDYWGDDDATVVCRQMGFGEGKGVKGAQFGRGKGPVWLDNLRCIGNESRLQDCSHNSYAVQNCNHGEDAGVYCKGTSEKPIQPPGTGIGPEVVTEKTRSDTLTEEVLESGNTIVIAVTVTIIVILIAIIAIGGYILYRRTRKPSGEIKKVLVHNDMNDPNPLPAPTGADGRVTLSKLKAHFSKSKLNDDESGAAELPTEGVTNPVYQENKNKGVIMEEEIEQPHHAGFSI